MNTLFLGGQSIDSVLFFQLLNMKKNLLEAKRDWMILRDFDSTLTFTAADDYTGSKSLPARFLRVYTPYDARQEEQTGVYIVDSAGNRNPLKPIPFARRFEYKDTNGYFYIDVKNSKIGRTGTLAGTLHLFFLKGTADIEAGTTWEFPTFSHPLLAYEVAIEQKGGIDWDRVNANQVPYNKNTSNEIMSGLNMWDSRLQQTELGV